MRTFSNFFLITLPSSFLLPSPSCFLLLPYLTPFLLLFGPFSFLLPPPLSFFLPPPSVLPLPSFPGAPYPLLGIVTRSPNANITLKRITKEGGSRPCGGALGSAQPTMCVLWCWLGLRGRGELVLREGVKVRDTWGVGVLGEGVGELGAGHCGGS